MCNPVRLAATRGSGERASGDLRILISPFDVLEAECRLSDGRRSLKGTAYDILRHQGVQIGKANYMAHLAGRVRSAEAG